MPHADVFRRTYRALTRVMCRDASIFCQCAQGRGAARRSCAIGGAGSSRSTDLRLRFWLTKPPSVEAPSTPHTRRGSRRAARGLHPLSIRVIDLMIVTVDALSRHLEKVHLAVGRRQPFPTRDGAAPGHPFAGLATLRWASVELRPLRAHADPARLLRLSYCLRDAREPSACAMGGAGTRCRLGPQTARAIPAGIDIGPFIILLQLCQRVPQRFRAG